MPVPDPIKALVAEMNQWSDGAEKHSVVCLPRTRARYESEAAITKQWAKRLEAAIREAEAKE